jgi:pyridoxine 5-phosphate synthase
MRPWRPGVELNIEGYPDERLFEIVREVRPEQCTLVPDLPNAFTSEEGWKLDGSDDAIVENAMAALKPLGCRIILFVDPDPNVVARLGNTGADGVEIYTGTYAAAFRAGNSAAELRACGGTAARAKALGLVVNAGHDLNLKNLPDLVASVPNLAEASIGHELTADALEIGFCNAVRAYRAALAGSAC